MKALIKKILQEESLNFDFLRGQNLVGLRFFYIEVPGYNYRIVGMDGFDLMIQNEFINRAPFKYLMDDLIENLNSGQYQLIDLFDTTKIFDQLQEAETDDFDWAREIIRNPIPTKLLPIINKGLKGTTWHIDLANETENEAAQKWLFSQGFSWIDSGTEIIENRRNLQSVFSDNVKDHTLTGSGDRGSWGYTDSCRVAQNHHLPQPIQIIWSTDGGYLVSNL